MVVIPKMPRHSARAQKRRKHYFRRRVTCPDSPTKGAFKSQIKFKNLKVENPEHQIFYNSTNSPKTSFNVLQRPPFRPRCAVVPWRCKNTKESQKRVEAKNHIRLEFFCMLVIFFVLYFFCCRLGDAELPRSPRATSRVFYIPVDKIGEP